MRTDRTPRLRLPLVIARSMWPSPAAMVSLFLAALGCGGDPPTAQPSLGVLQVSVSTTGGDLDPDGYGVRVAAGGYIQPIDVDGTVVFSKLTPGQYFVELSGVAPHCAVAGPNPHEVTVTAQQVVSVSFAVSCLATGTLQVTTVSTGSDVDPSGYGVWVDAGPAKFVASNGIATFPYLSPGDHAVRLSGVAENCTVVGDNPRTVTVTVGGGTRPIATVTFQVTCERSWQLAFTRQNQVALTDADGVAVEIVGVGETPTWSPDGARLAYACASDHGLELAICIASLDGTETVQLSGTWDESPAWHPDGSSIAIAVWNCDHGCHFEGLFLMSPDGSSRYQVPLPHGLEGAGNLAWSPDGRQLAFDCELSWNVDICLVSLDGSGFRRLTTDPASDQNPAWKPDGSSIAYQTDRYGPTEIVLTSPDGGAITRLSPGTVALDPAWSPDGLRIAFAGQDGLYVMNADGTGQTRLTFGSDRQPAWRP